MLRSRLIAPNSSLLINKLVTPSIPGALELLILPTVALISSLVISASSGTSKSLIEFICSMHLLTLRIDRRCVSSLESMSRLEGVRESISLAVISELNLSFKMHIHSTSTSYNYFIRERK